MSLKSFLLFIFREVTKEENYPYVKNKAVIFWSVLSNVSKISRYFLRKQLFTMNFHSNHAYYQNSLRILSLLQVFYTLLQRKKVKMTIQLGTVFKSELISYRQKFHAKIAIILIFISVLLTWLMKHFRDLSFYKI